MGREWAWNGWASDPLPSACARSGVACFISVCSVVLLHCDDPAGLCQARLIFIKELSCQKQSNMAAWLLRVQVSVILVGALVFGTKHTGLLSLYFRGLLAWLEAL